VKRYLAGEEHAHPFGNASWESIGVRELELPELVNCPVLALARRAAAPAAAS